MKNKFLSILLGALLCASTASAMQEETKKINDPNETIEETNHDKREIQIPKDIYFSIMIFCDAVSAYNFGLCCKELHNIYTMLTAGEYHGVNHPVMFLIKSDPSINNPKTFHSEMQVIKFTPKIGVPIEIVIVDSLWAKVKKIFHKTPDYEKKLIMKATSVKNLKEFLDKITRKGLCPIIFFKNCMLRKDLLSDLPKKIKCLTIEDCRLFESSHNYDPIKVKKLCLKLTSKELERNKSESKDKQFAPYPHINLKGYIIGVDTTKLEIFDFVDCEAMNTKVDALFAVVPITSNKVIIIKHYRDEDRTEKEVFKGKQIIKKMRDAFTFFAFYKDEEFFEKFGYEDED
jgi:hypothetical protein